MINRKVTQSKPRQTEEIHYTEPLTDLHIGVTLFIKLQNGHNISKLNK
jgi:hypothetical protein